MHTTSVSHPNVGVIGLGAMGLPMAQRLLAAGTTVRFISRSPKPDLTAAGAEQLATGRELADASDSILIMLPDLPELEAALAGAGGLLAGTTPLLIMVASTTSATGFRELAERVSAETAGRVRLVDCPVSGGVGGATAGTLSIMVGGSEDDAAIAVATLAPCGNPVHLGPLGAGQVAKACNQLIVSATILALGEATVLADRSGLDLDKMWNLLAGGYAGSNLLAARKEKLISGDDSPLGMAGYMVKDLTSAAQIAQATETNTVMLPTLRAAFDDIVAAGLGERDIAVARRFIAERATNDAARNHPSASD